MRWEIISTHLQQADARKRRNRIESLLLRVYAFALKLYPSAFRAAFADEMLAVFAMTLRETIGASGLMQVVWRELLDLPRNIISSRHKFPAQPANALTIWRTRQVIRLSSAILSLIMLHSLVQTLTTPQTILADALRLGLFYTLLFCTSVSMLLAWRWERLGGALTAGCGMAIGTFLTFYIGYFHPAEISLIGLILIGLLWMLPFVIIGLLFHQLSYCESHLSVTTS